MVSVDGAQQVVPLIGEYQKVTAALAAAQQAVAGGVQIENMECHGQIGGNPAVLYAPTKLSVADSATVLNALIGIWQNELKQISALIDAVT